MVEPVRDDIFSSPIFSSSRVAFSLKDRPKMPSTCVGYILSSGYKAFYKNVGVMMGREMDIS